MLFVTPYKITYDLIYIMRKSILLTAFAALTLSVSVFAQVSTQPAIIQQGYEGEVTIIFNPNEGNKGMVGATACYAHTGITYNGKQWQQAPTWRGGEAKYKMTKNAAGNWELKITPSIFAYYGVSDTTQVTQLCFVFNDGPNGNKEGKTASGGDIFVDLVEAGFTVAFTSEIPEISEKGAQVSVTAMATEACQLRLLLNGEEVKSGNGKEITYTTTLSKEGDYVFECIGTTETETARETLSTCVPKAPQRANRPAGVLNGIYYDATDETKVTLCTYAASKTTAAKHVFVVGDFNDWTISDAYQLKQANDSAYFWITLDGLTPREEYAYQYVVVRKDGQVKRISDLYSEKVLHPDDQYEPLKVDSTLKPYPQAADGYCTVIQTGRAPYAWSDATLNFKRPDKNNLIIYELWVYDYTPFRSIPALAERLDYLETLGVNAIELMPVCEFDGNYNWGYSPNHYFALDKAYGSPDMLKAFVDECHKRGMAVILDMVFNHATGLNPMNKLYPYGTELKDNPWFNVTPPHSDNVYEDWNHDFVPAKTMFTRALQYWLREYKVDGYRMDLSHGLCGTANNAVSHIMDYYEKGVKAVAEDAYFILEHWGSNMGSDRPKLVNAGMLCWENTNNAYCQTAMGWLKDGDGFGNANKDGYVSYCESHDEERMQYKCKQWGNGAIKTDESVRLGRIAENVVFNVLLNGPHMIWQYEEIGFDFSINSSLDKPNGTSNDDRCSKKPRPENRGYFQDSRRMAQYAKVAQACQLRTRLLPEVFAGNPTTVSVGSGKAVRTIQWGSDVFVVANFHPTSAQDAALPTGTWYDYYNGGTSITGGTTLSLHAGEVRIFTGKTVELPEVPQSFDFALSIGKTEMSVEPSAAGCEKILQNGEILIRRGEQLYDLTGRRRQ